MAAMMYVSFLRDARCSRACQIPESCWKKARHLVRLYHKQFCRSPTQANRTLVLKAAKEVDKLMKIAGKIAGKIASKTAESRAGGFAASPASRKAGAWGASLNDINNNLRLFMDAVRRLVEVGSVAVCMFLACETYD
jgi:hypothetical protein